MVLKTNGHTCGVNGNQQKNLVKDIGPQSKDGSQGRQGLVGPLVLCRHKSSKIQKRQAYNMHHPKEKGMLACGDQLCRRMQSTQRGMVHCPATIWGGSGRA